MRRSSFSWNSPSATCLSAVIRRCRALIRDVSPLRRWCFLITAPAVHPSSMHLAAAWFISVSRASRWDCRSVSAAVLRLRFPFAACPAALARCSASLGDNRLRSLRRMASGEGSGWAGGRGVASERVAEAGGEGGGRRRREEEDPANDGRSAGGRPTVSKVATAATAATAAAPAARAAPLMPRPLIRSPAPASPWAAAGGGAGVGGSGWSCGGGGGAGGRRGWPGSGDGDGGRLGGGEGGVSSPMCATAVRAGWGGVGVEGCAPYGERRIERTDKPFGASRGALESPHTRLRSGCHARRPRERRPRRGKPNVGNWRDCHYFPPPGLALEGLACGEPTTVASAGLGRFQKALGRPDTP